MCLRRMLTTARVRRSAEPAAGPPSTTLIVLSAKNAGCAKIDSAPDPQSAISAAVKMIFIALAPCDKLAVEKQSGGAFNLSQVAQANRDRRGNLHVRPLVPA